MATLARGGRLNIFGFVLRLAGMVPFLFIGGRIYGAASLGRFAYAVLVVEFAAQIAALGLRRGLAQLIADAKKPQSCIIADSLLVAALGSAVGMAILILFPKAMYPTTSVEGLDRLLAITVIAIAWTDIALAALAYHNDVASTVRARSIVQPWVISIGAFALSFLPSMVKRGDGLIIAYVLSMVAALVAALIRNAENRPENVFREQGDRQKRDRIAALRALPRGHSLERKPIPAPAEKHAGLARASGTNRPIARLDPVPALNFPQNRVGAQSVQVAQHAVVVENRHVPLRQEDAEKIPVLVAPRLGDAVLELTARRRVKRPAE